MATIVIIGILSIIILAFGIQGYIAETVYHFTTEEDFNYIPAFIAIVVGGILNFITILLIIQYILEY